MASESIDFQEEWGRHEAVLGREDVLEMLDAWLLEGPPRGWVLVKGGPGMGKSALLTKWLKRREAAGKRWPPHHFLRRGHEDWDRPEVVKRNLAAQVEAQYPEQANPEARPESRLRELLQRVSREVLVPRGERLVLVVDGLDEVEVEVDGSNPLPRLLPHVLPQGVKLLCASRPTYPYLSWVEARDGGVRAIDMDGEQWAGSNRAVVRQYLARAGRGFEPPLKPAFVEEVVKRAEGNVLYTVKLVEWLHEQPEQMRRAELLPRGLEALLEESWERLLGLPHEDRKVVLEGLGGVCVAREALPRSVLEMLAGWKRVEDVERFLKVTRSFLLEEPGTGRNEKAWRPFHESFQSFILSKLGERRERELHVQLAEQLCRWPVDVSDPGFRRNYALRHGVIHWLKAREWEQARRLYTDLGYLEAKCEWAGVLSVEEDLQSAAVEGPEREREIPRALHRAIQVNSYWLKKDPKALDQLVYNRLRCSGWAENRIVRTLRLAKGLPALRLRHPIRTDESERTLEGHGRGVNSCAATADGRRVVSASGDGTLRVWEMETGRELITLEGHSGDVLDCAVTADGNRVVSASSDGTLKVWDLGTGRELATLKGHEKAVYGCAVTADGRRVVSASGDKTLKIWELETGRELATLKGHRRAVRACAMMPDGRRVVSGSDDKTLIVWDIETGRELVVLKGHRRAVRACAVVPDGRRVVSASIDKSLKVWEVETGREEASLKGHEAAVWDCAVTPDGLCVISASWDKTLKVWELKTGRVLATLEGHGSLVSGCVSTHGGEYVVSASHDRTLKTWKLRTGLATNSLEGHADRVRSCAITPDGRRLVSASDDETLKIWELETGQRVATLEGHGSGIWGCAVTPDGGRVVSTSDDGALKVWDIDTGRELATLQGRGERVRSCAVMPDGRCVISASDDKMLRLLDLETGRELAALNAHERSVSDCVAMPDGGRVVSASADGTLRIWDVLTGRELATLEGHESGVRACAVMSGGRRLVSASDDGTLKIWDVETGRELVTLRGHGGAVRGCAVTPNGRYLISASADKTLSLWDVESGRRTHVLYGFAAFLSVVATDDVVCAGDVLGNVWIVDLDLSVCGEELKFMDGDDQSSGMKFHLPRHLFESCRTNPLALFVGSGLSLGDDIQADLPGWHEIPQRLLDACERFGSLNAQFIQSKRALFKGRMRLEVMLAELGTLCTALDRDYQKALNDIFRPADAAPGAAHEAVARLGVRAILTTNYDQLLEQSVESPRRQPYTWKESHLALDDLEAGRRVLLKVHGTAERHDTVVMSEREYDRVRSDASYQKVLSHLLQRYTFLFIGYGMNDPLDLDLVLKWNAEAFKSAARRHYALLRNPSDADRDRYEREYNVRVIPFSDYAQIPDILDALGRTASSQATGT